jgi:hypothetical protein
VTETGFEVGLSFGGIPEKLSIPYNAVKGFFDPSVQFGLQFEVLRGDEAGDAAAPQAVPTPVLADRAPVPERSLLDRPAPRAVVAPAPEPVVDNVAEEDAEERSSTVVSLDQFRKKT